MNDLTIPPWPGLSFGDQRSPSASRNNRTARAIHDQTRRVAARNRRYGAVFGETWLSADPDIVEAQGGYFYLRGILCLGELDAILDVEIAGNTYTTSNPESGGNYRGDWDASTTWDPPHSLPYAAQVDEIYRFNGKYYRVKTAFTVTGTSGADTPIGSSYRNNFTQIYANTNVNTYRGAPGQGVDPIMVEAFGAGYTETLTGNWYGNDYQLAYITAKLPANQFEEGYPTIKARARGWRCYDPRSGLTNFTRNGALHLATFIESPLVGLNKPVNWDSVIAPANRCDTAFADGARIECNLEVGGKPVQTERWLEQLRAYSCALLDYREGEYHLVADEPRSVDRHVSFPQEYADIEMLAPPIIDPVGTTEHKNVHRVKYTDTSVTPWKERTVTAVSDAVASGDDTPRIQEHAMPGLHTPEQAQRYADERLAEHVFERWVATVPVPDEGQNIRIGEVLVLSSPNGLSSAPARVLGKRHTDFGQWLLRCRDYSVLAYLEP